MINLNFFVYLTTYWWVLKAPPLKSSDVHFSVIKCHCQTYDDNIGPKLKKPSFAIFGAYNKAPVLDLSWKTKKCTAEEIRGGAFSIRLNISFPLQCMFQFSGHRKRKCDKSTKKKSTKKVNATTCLIRQNLLLRFESSLGGLVGL